MGLLQTTAAASGGRLELIPTGGEAVEYEIVVDGDVSIVDSGPHNAGDSDSLSTNADGTTTIDGATGSTTSNGGDTYDLDGEVLAFSADGQLSVTLDGNSTSVSELDGGRDKFTIIPTDGAVEYTLDVDGSLSAVTTGSQNAEPGKSDSVQGDGETVTVAGATGSKPATGGDMWMVDGEITGLSIDGGSADTYVNGSAVSADDLGETGGQQPQRTLLEISRAPGSSGTVKYIVETDGSVKPGSHRNDDHYVGGVDAIHGSNASGEVSDDIDPYVLEDVSRIEVTSAGGNLTTTIDGETVDLTDGGSLSSVVDKRGDHVPFDDGGWTDEFESFRHQENVGLVDAPSVSGRALAVDVPAGQHYGASGRFPLDHPDEAWAQHYVYFDEGWDFGDDEGGKQPGFAGTYDGTGYGGNRADGTNGWSARMVQDPADDGRPHLGFYVYHMDMGQWGSEWMWDTPTAVLDRGRWYRIDQHVRLNTPGRADGVLEGWVDGEKAYERRDVRFRADGHGDIGVREFWFDIYWGGSWSSPSDNRQYFDELRVSTDGPVSSDLE